MAILVIDEMKIRGKALYLMLKHTRNKLPTSLSTFFAPIKAIFTRNTRLASSELNP